MSIRLMSAVWEMDLPSMQKLVLLAIADCANDDGLAWPSIATIARKSGCGERTVQRSIREIEQQGFLERQEVHGKGCRYWVIPRHSDTPATVTPPPQSHPTPATVTGDPRHSDTQTTNNHQEPSENPPVGPPAGLPLDDEPEAPVKVRKSRKGEMRLMPENWSPDEFGPDTKAGPVVAAWSRDEFEHQLEKFKSFHTARGTKFADWQAGWRTWVLNSRRFGNGNRTAQPSHDHRDGFARAIDRRIHAGDAEGFADEPDGRTVQPGEGHRQGALALPSGGR